VLLPMLLCCGGIALLFFGLLGAAGANWR